MKIVLGEKNDKTIKFAEKIKGIFADEMCGIKFIKEEVDIYIPYARILDNGMIENTNLYFEEVLLTLNIKKVYYRYVITESIEKILSFYQIDFYTEYSV